jgi:signal transduction histidine kinase
VTVGPSSVTVNDTGAGMGEEELANAFRPFYRGQRRDARGHGIGLSIVKRLSDRFGWPVELASELGVGTRATITFPNPQVV